MGFMTFPVKAYAATEDKDIERHNLHSECKGRVSQVKVCQVCLADTLGERKADIEKHIAARKAIPQEWLSELGLRGLAVVMPMTDETMVKGYELVKDQYIVVSDSELETIKLKSAKAVQIVKFVESAEFDPRMPEKHYFVAPDSKGGGVKPFSLLIQAMKDTGKYAIGRVMMRATSGKESLVLLRPFGDILLMHTLAWPEELRDASELRYERVPISDKERALAKQLVETMVGEGFGDLHDQYSKKLVELLLTKDSGGKIEAPKPEAEAPVLDMADALLRSIEAAKNKGGDVVAQAEAVAAGVSVAVAEAPAPAPEPAPAPKKARKTAKKA